MIATTFLLAETGDKTQLKALAAQLQRPVAASLGTVLAMVMAVPHHFLRSRRQGQLSSSAYVLRWFWERRSLAPSQLAEIMQSKKYLSSERGRDMDFSVLRLSKTNCYLLKVADGYLLIDTGYVYDEKQFRSEMKRLGMKADEIRAIFLTHHHDDHSGLLNYLVTLNPAIRLILHEHAVGLLHTGENDRTRGGGWVSWSLPFLSRVHKLLHPEWSLSFPPYNLRDQDVIIRGDNSPILRDLGLEGDIIYTPGHSIDSISIVLDDGSAFVGDAAANFLQWAGTRYSPLFLTDLREYYRSWERLLELGVGWIYPAHGLPFEPARLQKNLGAVRELIPLEW